MALSCLLYPAPMYATIKVMKIVDSISLAELRQMSNRMYGAVVKADVDVVRKVVIVDMDMHADGEAYLLEHGSKQADLWGINLHPDEYGADGFVEFDSIINIRPRQNNPSRSVVDAKLRRQITDIVSGVVHE